DLIDRPIILQSSTGSRRANQRFMRDPRVDKLAGVLVRYSTAVRPGQLVSLVGPFPARELLVALFRETLSAGAHPVILAAPEECTEIMLRQGSDKQVLFANPLEMREVELADVSIHVIARSEEHTSELQSLRHLV